MAQVLQGWLERYILFAKSAPFETVYESYIQYRGLWIALPELVWNAPGLRPPSFGTNDDEMRAKIVSFCVSFARLTAYFVEFDCMLLQRPGPAESARELISPVYLLALSSITRREPLKNEDRLEISLENDDVSLILDRFLTFYNVQPCCTLFLLCQLLEAQTLLMPTYPKIIENFSHICVVSSAVVREAFRKYTRRIRALQTVNVQTSRLALGQKIFTIAASALNTAIANHITHLTYEGSSNQIAALGDLVYINLKLDQKEAARLAASIQGTHPIPHDCVADAFAMKWRFDLFCRLVKDSQMQLRLMAVTNLCQELVSCWRRYGEQAAEELREESVLRYVTDLLATNGVVTYLLGPTCHPEITAESGNIIGFLAVSRTYTQAHTDLFWQTVTTTQDLRISEALIRTMCRITNLFPYDAAVYICQEFLVLPVSSFTPSMRDLCESFLRQVYTKASLQDPPEPERLPFRVYLRLLRLSSVPGHKASISYPEVQLFATERITDYVGPSDSDQSHRRSLYQSCLSDLKQKSETTLGSLCAINILTRHFMGRDMAYLISEKNLIQLVVDELEDAISKSSELAFPGVIGGPCNGPRREVIYQILSGHPYSLTPELSSRLWEMMFGATSACKEDRTASWKILIACAKRIRNENNPFVTQCLSDFLPLLSPDYFCEGLLEFLRERLVPLVNDISCSILDVDSGNELELKTVSEENKSIDRIALEQLWRIVLTAPPDTIERHATHFLVKDVYIDSRAICSFPLYRSRKIHLALVSRCLRQLSAAAKKLKSLGSDDTTAAAPDAPEMGDDVTMATVDSDELVLEQELLFIRSLQVLQEFLQLYRASSQFSTPDLRSFISEGTKDIEGESAELKYQSFDGDNQTEVRHLNIGRRNTAASLLASLKEATGFDNYRIYYRGQAFVPQEGDVCRSLEDLRIHNGLILVKRDVDPDVEPADTNPSSSPIEAEILSHFQELWEYLTMSEHLASEIHEFLVQLTVDERFLSLFEQDGLSYKEVFSIGQPYKSLYALHALREFLIMRHRQANEGAAVAFAASKESNVSNANNADDIDTKMATPESMETAVESPQKDEPASEEQPAADGAAKAAYRPQTYTAALEIATTLITAAICDPSITEVSASTDLQVDFFVKLLQLLDFVLEGSLQNELVPKSLDAHFLERLMDILSTALENGLTKSSTHLVKLAFRAIMNSCSLSCEFWVAFKSHPKTSALIKCLLLGDDRLAVRQLAEHQIGDKVVLGRGPSVVGVNEFREFFWPKILDIVPKALQEPTKCEGVFNLADGFLGKMIEASPPTLDIAALLRQMGDLLLSYTTLEDMTQTECPDYAMFGLTRMTETIYRAAQNLDLLDILPSDYANKLFWKHLFPPWQRSASEAEDSLIAMRTPYPRVVVTSQTRLMLMKVIFDIVDDHPSQLAGLIQSLDQLVPSDVSDDEEPYHYDLPLVFERHKALRAPCGYVGMKNLSNTCYFNSLLTQLFMNVEFRQFMMNAEVRDEAGAQGLLFQTRILFAWMQNSIRRFVETQMCVASIKTYDDTPIDIHNQMDVDEFYNLLFDRWEGQLLSADDKKAFRSFYGGQLVQQVRSKECEHVSERLEPFSAIQCDIKGKASLQESLQAYVDGEIMEGGELLGDRRPFIQESSRR